MFPFQQRQVEGMVSGVVDGHLIRTQTLQRLAILLLQMLSLLTLRTGHATAAVG